MIKIGTNTSAPSFDHPLEMLSACHQKILQQCATLNKMLAHIQTQGYDQQIQQAAQGVLRYFDTAGMFHHQDEEEDLFPALLNNAHDVNVNALLQKLLEQHQIMLASWSELRVILQQLADGFNIALPHSLVEKFIRVYTEHIAIEEVELLPLSAQLFNANELLQLGISMAKRRGVSFHISH